MRGKRYLDLANEIVVGSAEVHWRGAVGRAYYALMLECREALYRWGFTPPPRDNVHTFVRLRFTFPADMDLRSIGVILEAVGRLRNHADYDLSPLPVFSNDRAAKQAVQNVTVAIDLLEAIDADLLRQAAAVAAIRKAFP